MFDVPCSVFCVPSFEFRVSCFAKPSSQAQRGDLLRVSDYLVRDCHSFQPRNDVHQEIATVGFATSFAKTKATVTSSGSDFNPDPDNYRDYRDRKRIEKDLIS